MEWWSNEFTLHFLELYKEEPCLWDPSNPHYKRKEKVASAWMRLGERTGKPVAELRRKKDSLMATFRGLLRKQKASIKNGAEGSAVYQPVWFAFYAMESFLAEVYGLNTQDMNTYENDHFDISDVKTEDNESSQLTPPIPSPPIGQPTSPSCQPTVRRRKNPLELREAEKDMNETFALLKNVVSRHEEEDECDLYARILAKKLRKLPDWERQLIMHEIDGMVLNAMHRSRCFPSSSSTSPVPHSNGGPSNMTSFDSFSSHDQSHQQHTEDIDIDSKADIVTFEDTKMLS